jgi:hypothetical protein
MRILIVSYVFPPFNNIGTLRVGKTAKYLYQLGHEIRVVTTSDIPYPPVLTIEIPAEHVTRTKWINVNRPADLIFGTAYKYIHRFLPSLVPSYQWTEDRLRWLYGLGFNIPDGAIGWLPFCLSAASKVCASFKPHIILASAPPPTALIAAHVLSRKFSVPWVADFRDLWTGDHYRRYPWIRQMPERLVEKKILSSASGLITISHPLAEILRRRFGKPTKVILNGFDPEDVPAQQQNSHDPRLRLIYTGTLHHGRRNVGPVLKAIANNAALAKHVSIDFFITEADAIILSKQIAQYAISASIRIHPWITYTESLVIQRSADVLLLPMWDHPSEVGVFTGKLFEYIGSRRPILTVTTRNNVAARLIHARRLGLASNDSQEIASQLVTWLDQKKRMGHISDFPIASTRGLSREDQTRNLEIFLEGIVRATISSEEFRSPAQIA